MSNVKILAKTERLLIFDVFTMGSVFWRVLKLDGVQTQPWGMFLLLSSECFPSSLRTIPNKRLGRITSSVASIFNQDQQLLSVIDFLNNYCLWCLATTILCHWLLSQLLVSHSPSQIPNSLVVSIPLKDLTVVNQPTQINIAEDKKRCSKPPTSHLWLVVISHD